MQQTKLPHAHRQIQIHMLLSFQLPLFVCSVINVLLCFCPLLLGWNELLIASFSHRSIAVKDGILLATGLHVHRNSAHTAGVGAIFDRLVNVRVFREKV